MPRSIEVAEPCAGTVGHHYCVTHDYHATNNWDSRSHENDNKGCEFVWVCPEHGYERAS